MSKLELRPEQRGYMLDFTAIDMESGVLRMTRHGRVKVVRAFADACQENQSTKNKDKKTMYKSFSYVTLIIHSILHSQSQSYPALNLWLPKTPEGWGVC